MFLLESDGITMTDFLDALSNACGALDIRISEDTAKLCESYAELMLEYNKNVNLTAITEIRAVAVKHFADSLALLKITDIPHGASLLDVGTGAGFPGIPLLASRPDLTVTLIDGTDKKLEFIRGACKSLGLNPNIVHARAEEYAHSAVRGIFDIVTARAVAQLRVLCEYCIPFLKQGGCFLAMKSGDIDTELKEAQGALKLLGGKIERTERFELPEAGARSVTVIKKISQTPTEYPRASTRIAKKPL